MTKAEHHRKWYRQNRAKKIAQVREWQAGNHAKTLAYKRKWNSENKDYLRQAYLDRKNGLK